MRTKLFHLFTILVLLVPMFLSIPADVAQANSPASRPIPPSDSGPTGSDEDTGNQPQPLGVPLHGDQPQGEDWYNLPESAFTPSVGGALAIGIKQVVAGLSHTCVLSNSGGVKCWGDNWEGKLGDGTIVDSNTPVDVVGLTSGVVAIDSSHKHTCALTSAGGVKCWGRNWHGELGDGTVVYRVEPVDVVGLTSGVKAIAVGGFHTCALLVTGGVKCWGANWHGELGNGNKDESHVPVDVVNLGSPVVALAAGKYHTCAVLDTGFVKCWGYNAYGQLGNNMTEDKSTPMKVVAMNANIVAITAGEVHTCALTDYGGVKCWGDNSQGQTGDGTTYNYWTPADVYGLSSGVVSIETGMFYSCAILDTGGIKCWGNNWAGQLGDGTQEGRLIPTDVIGLDAPVTSMSAGDSHTCAVLDTGGVKCWGSNSYGQIGDGTSSIRLEPVDVYGLTVGVAAIAVGASHTCAITTGGAVKCWGSNTFGQLGDGTNIDSVVPVDVVGLDEGVTAIAAGSYHTCAAVTKKDGSGDVECWGYNQYGQVGDGSRVNRNTPQGVNGISTFATAVTAGANHSCALIQNGSVIKCWGRNNNGQLGIGNRDDFSGAVRVDNLEGLSFSSISAGERHTCATTINGDVKCWGFNSNGQLGDGTTDISSVPADVVGIDNTAAKVITGDSHTCILTFSGGMKCWGDALYGQLGNGTYYPAVLTPEDVPGLTSGVVSIAAGSFHTCAILSTGVVQCWGNNQAGQIGDGTTFIRLSPVDVPSLTGSVVSLDLGAYTSCAIMTDSGAKCWGTNEHGQVGDGTIPWQLTPLLVKNLFQPTATLNYNTGLPGSYFTASAVNLTAEAVTTIRINGLPLSPTLTADSNGVLAFLLYTAGADIGSYVVTIDTGDDRLNLTFRLTSTDPQRPQESSGTIYQVPAGIAMTHTFYLPLGIK